MKNEQRKTSGNPILPGKGVCDPHIRVFGDRAYLYATHDRSIDSQGFCMDDWWCWSSGDLVNWKHECSLRPEQTYIGKGFQQCWATDAATRNGKYYWYFSEGGARTGVVVGESPVGPWKDVLGKPMIGDGVIPVGAYDPGVFVDDDGTPYMVFGVWDYYIARLNDDMISLAEAPRKVTVANPEGPYGKGKMDDKPYLHKRGGVYYLSWGCFYGMSRSVYGPYECRGSVVQESHTSAEMRYKGHGLTYDRHGSFFEWRGQWYYICNDMSRDNCPHFRDSCLSYVDYLPNGEIEPVELTAEGVRLGERETRK